MTSTNRRNMPLFTRNMEQIQKTYDTINAEAYLHALGHHKRTCIVEKIASPMT